MIEKPSSGTVLFSRDWLIRLAATCGAIGVLWAFLTPIYVRFVADDVAEEARETLGVARMEENQERIQASLDAAVSELSSHLEAIDQRLEAVAGEAQRALGADGILELRPGSAYVAEPIYVGDDVVRIHAEARRTLKGINCKLDQRYGTFEVQGGRVLTGQVLGVLRPLGRDFEDYEFEFQAPPEVTAKPGRVTVIIISTYQCGDALVRDVRAPLSFTVNRLGERGSLAHPTPSVRQALVEEAPTLGELLPPIEAE